MTKLFRILQITDLHLFAQPNETLVGVNTYRTAAAVFAKAASYLKTHPVDLALITGDLSQDFSAESYEIVLKFCESLGCPFSICMGNHDASELFSKFCGKNPQHILKEFIFDDWLVLLLNTHWVGHVSGKLESTELEFLNNELLAHQDKSALIFLHHQILPTTNLWLNKIGVINTAEFLEIISRYKNIKAVVSGHVHQDNFLKQNGVDFITTCSTSWQFAPSFATFHLDAVMPGFRWFELSDAGIYTTGIIRVEQNPDFLPDLNSMGY